MPANQAATDGARFSRLQRDSEELVEVTSVLAQKASLDGSTKTRSSSTDTIIEVVLGDSSRASIANESLARPETPISPGLDDYTTSRVNGVPATGTPQHNVTAWMNNLDEEREGVRLDGSELAMERGTSLQQPPLAHRPAGSGRVDCMIADLKAHWCQEARSLVKKSQHNQAIEIINSTLVAYKQTKPKFGIELTPLKLILVEAWSDKAKTYMNAARFPGSPDTNRDYCAQAVAAFAEFVRLSDLYQSGNL